MKPPSVAQTMLKFVTARVGILGVFKDSVQSRVVGIQFIS